MHKYVNMCVEKLIVVCWLSVEKYFLQVSRQSWKVTHKLQKSYPIWYSTV